VDRPYKSSQVFGGCAGGGPEVMDSLMEGFLRSSVFSCVERLKLALLTAPGLLVLGQS